LHILLQSVKRWILPLGPRPFGQVSDFS